MYDADMDDLLQRIIEADARHGWVMDTVTVVLIVAVGVVIYLIGG